MVVHPDWKLQHHQLTYSIDDPGLPLGSRNAGILSFPTRGVWPRPETLTPGAGPWKQFAVLVVAIRQAFRVSESKFWRGCCSSASGRLLLSVSTLFLLLACLVLTSFYLVDVCMDDQDVKKGNPIGVANALKEHASSAQCDKA